MAGYVGSDYVGQLEVGAAAAAAVVEQPQQDDAALHFDDGGAQDVIAVPSGYQNRDVPPRVQDSDAHLFDEGFEEDPDAAFVEAAAESAPVQDQPVQDDSPALVEDFEDDIHDLMAELGPVQPQAPPDQPPQDVIESFDDDESVDDDLQSGPVVADATPVNGYEDDLADEDEDDEWADYESASVGPDAPQPQEPVRDDPWVWDEEAHDPVAIPGGYQNNDVAPRVQDVEPFAFDDEQGVEWINVPHGGQQSDAQRTKYDDDFAEDVDEGWDDYASQIVGTDFVALPALGYEVAPDQDDLDDEWADYASAPVGPDAAQRTKYDDDFVDDADEAWDDYASQIVGADFVALPALGYEVAPDQDDLDDEWADYASAPVGPDAAQPQEPGAVETTAGAQVVWLDRNVIGLNGPRRLKKLIEEHEAAARAESARRAHQKAQILRALLLAA